MLKCQYCAMSARGFEMKGSETSNVGCMGPDILCPTYHPAPHRRISLLASGTRRVLSFFISKDKESHVWFLIIKLDSTLKMFSKQCKMLQRSISFSNMVSSILNQCCDRNSCSCILYTFYCICVKKIVFIVNHPKVSAVS